MAVWETVQANIGLVIGSVAFVLVYAVATLAWDIYKFSTINHRLDRLQAQLDKMERQLSSVPVRDTLLENKNTTESAPHLYDERMDK